MTADRVACSFRDYVILIPHQMPPRLVSPWKCELAPAASDDKYVNGDHDMHSSIVVGDWLDNPELRGHQRHEVNQLLADEAARRGEPSPV